MKRKVTLTRTDDSQNCYVYQTVTGPGQVLVKVWVPRRDMKYKAAQYLDVDIKSVTEQVPLKEAAGAKGP